MFLKQVLLKTSSHSYTGEDIVSVQKLMGFRDFPFGRTPSGMLLNILLGFVIGWVIHSLIKYLRRRR